MSSLAYAALIVAMSVPIIGKWTATGQGDFLIFLAAIFVAIQGARLDIEKRRSK